VQESKVGKMNWLRRLIRELIREEYSIAYSASVVAELKERIYEAERRQREVRVDAHQIAESAARRIVDNEKFLDDIVARLLKKQL
jgi:hypothetical protein